MGERKPEQAQGKVWVSNLGGFLPPLVVYLCTNTFDISRLINSPAAALGSPKTLACS